MNEEMMEKLASEYARFHYADATSQELCENDFKAGYVKGYEQAEKDTINRVCDWLEKNAVNYNGSESAFDHKEEEMIEELRKYFKEGIK